MRCADFFRFFVAKVKIYVLRLLPTHEDIKYLMFSFNGYRLLSKYRTMLLFDIWRLNNVMLSPKNINVKNIVGSTCLFISYVSRNYIFDYVDATHIKLILWGNGISQCVSVKTILIERGINSQLPSCRFHSHNWNLIV